MTQFINSYDIWAIDKDYKYDSSLICKFPSAFDKSKYKTSDPIYFGYDFKPNEESTFNIIYIASNEELKRNLVLLVNDAPFNGDENVDVKFTRINTVK